MNPEPDNEESTVAQRLVPLLKEVALTMEGFSTSARKLQNAWSRADKLNYDNIKIRAERDFNALQARFWKLHNPANELARQASQLVEHGRADVATRLELLVRLGEMEGAMQEAATRINFGPKS